MVNSTALIILLVLCYCSHLASGVPIPGEVGFLEFDSKRNRSLKFRNSQNPDVIHQNRVKRQFSLNFGATHQQNEGTDVTAEAIARLWRSRSGNTEVQGSASYNQHFGGFEGDGKAKISGMLTLTHNY